MLGQPNVRDHVIWAVCFGEKYTIYVRKIAYYRIYLFICLSEAYCQNIHLVQEGSANFMNSNSYCNPYYTMCDAFPMVKDFTNTCTRSTYLSFNDIAYFYFISKKLFVIETFM